MWNVRHFSVWNAMALLHVLDVEILFTFQLLISISSVYLVASTNWECDENCNRIQTKKYVISWITNSTSCVFGHSGVSLMTIYSFAYAIHHFYDQIDVLLNYSPETKQRMKKEKIKWMKKYKFRNPVCFWIIKSKFEVWSRQTTASLMPHFIMAYSFVWSCTKVRLANVPTFRYFPFSVSSLTNDYINIILAKWLCVQLCEWFFVNSFSFLLLSWEYINL